MKENQISITSIMTAYIRAYHSAYDSPKIFDDFLACSLLPDKARKSIEQGLTQALQYDTTDIKELNSQQMASLSGMLQFMGSPIVLSRSRYTEDNLKTAITQGAKQYVILGAGMDTFAFRNPDLMEHIQVFEVDHPNTQAFKRRRIKELGWEVPYRLHYVPIDFTQDDLITALMQSSFDPQSKSFFSWLGVTQYLSAETVFATLNTIAHSVLTGSTIVFDYHDNDIPDNAISQLRATLAQQTGELMKSSFNPLTLSVDLTDLGLHLFENLSPEDINNRYFQGRSDAYTASPHAHLAYAIIR